MSICLYNGTLLSGFAVMERCAVLIEEGQIADVFSQKRFEQKKFSPSTKVYDVEGAYIAPGFIDTHIHGFKGHGTEDGSTEAMLACPRIWQTTVSPPSTPPSIPPWRRTS